MAGRQFDTDVSRPAGLRTNLRQPQRAIDDSESGKYLDDVQEDWNRRVDTEVQTMVDGMVDMIELAALAEKDKFRTSEDAFEMETRAENMVRAAHSLLTITHSLKLMVLLSDESQAVERREQELAEIAQEIEEAHRKTAAEWHDIVEPPADPSEVGTSP